MGNIAELEIIDCHIHPFCRMTENYCFFPGENDGDNLVPELCRAGVSRCCGSVIRQLKQPSFQEIAELNRQAMDFRRRYPDFFIPGIHVHAAYPDESCREIEYYHEHEQLCWLGEWVAYMFDYKSYILPEMRQIYALAQDLALPVNIHPRDLSELAEICRDFPKLNVIIAHPTGDKAGIEARYELLSRFDNLYLDLSGAGLFRWQMLRYGVKKLGRHKFLFGSDYPICNPAMMIAAVKFELSDRADLEAIFSGNFKRLTGLK